MWLRANAKNIILCALFLIWALYYAADKAIDLPTFHIDGAFQTASALYRVNAGQIPDRDFLPYLGIGPTVTLFPVFKLLGSNLAASVTSAYFTTLALVALEIFVIAFLVLGQSAPQIPLIAAVSGPVLLTKVIPGGYWSNGKLGILSDTLRASIQPGNSPSPNQGFGTVYFSFHLLLSYFREPLRSMIL